MPKVVFVASNGKDTVEVDAPNGAALADLVDGSDAPIPFSCRSASCGTCHVEVLEGQELLLEPEDEELDVLDALDSKAPRFRLTCCAKAGTGAGTVRVRALNDL